MIPGEAAVFQETPWRDYSVMIDLRLRATAAAARWSTPTPTSGSTARSSSARRCSPRITAHEIFHAWNVKRLRPADMCAVPLRPAPGDHLALGERGDHRLLRRPRHGARRRGRLDGVPRSHAGQDDRGGGGAADRARGRLALHLDPSHRRQPVPLLPQGLARRADARHPDPRRERQPVLARRRDAGALPRRLQEGPRLHRHGLVARGEPARGRALVHRLRGQVRERPRAVPLEPRSCRWPGSGWSPTPCAHRR